MSFGIGCSDILAGVRIAVKLYDYGFAEENRAGIISPNVDAAHD